MDDHRLYGQVRYTGIDAGGEALWLGLGFPVIPGTMVGSTAIIGSSEGVNFYALGGKFLGAVTCAPPPTLDPSPPRSPPRAACACGGGGAAAVLTHSLR